MTWGKGLIIFLGLMQLSHVAHARDIENFTDSQGTRHITNMGSKKLDSPANPPSSGASLFPGSLRSNTPVPQPAYEPLFETESPEPYPEIQSPEP